MARKMSVRSATPYTVPAYEEHTRWPCAGRHLGVVTMADQLVPMPELGHALMERYGMPSPGYQHVHRMISKGLLVPERLVGRLFFKVEDLPTIAAKLGIVPAKKPARRAARAA
jgi:hypothetical protein